MGPSYVAPVPEMAQDDFIPVMRFVATSDTHIESLGDVGCQRASALIKTAYAISDADADYKNLDAVVFSGDLTDNGKRKSFYAFAATTDSELREGTERLAVVAKAHDSYTFFHNSLDGFCSNHPNHSSSLWAPPHAPQSWYPGDAWNLNHS